MGNQNSSEFENPHNLKIADFIRQENDYEGEEKLLSPEDLPSIEIAANYVRRKSMGYMRKDVDDMQVNGNGIGSGARNVTGNDGKTDQSITSKQKRNSIFAYIHSPRNAADLTPVGSPPKEILKPVEKQQKQVKTKKLFGNDFVKSIPNVTEAKPIVQKGFKVYNPEKVQAKMKENQKSVLRESLPHQKKMQPENVAFESSVISPDTPTNTMTETVFKPKSQSMFDFSNATESVASKAITPQSMMKLQSIKSKTPFGKSNIDKSPQKINDRADKSPKPVHKGLFGREPSSIQPVTERKSSSIFESGFNQPRSNTFGSATQPVKQGLFGRELSPVKKEERKSNSFKLLVDPTSNSPIELSRKRSLSPNTNTIPIKKKKEAKVGFYGPGKNEMTAEEREIIQAAKQARMSNESKSKDAFAKSNQDEATNLSLDETSKPEMDILENNKKENENKIIAQSPSPALRRAIESDRVIRFNGTEYFRGEKITESQVDCVTGISKDPFGGEDRIVYVKLVNGRYRFVSNTFARNSIGSKLIEFYEKNLEFV